MNQARILVDETCGSTQHAEGQYPVKLVKSINPFKHIKIASDDASLLMDPYWFLLPALPMEGL